MKTGHRNEELLSKVSAWLKEYGEQKVERVVLRESVTFMKMGRGQDEGG
jgi:hypothetical protein